MGSAWWDSSEVVQAGGRLHPLQARQTHSRNRSQVRHILPLATTVRLHCLVKLARMLGNVKMRSDGSLAVLAESGLWLLSCGYGRF
jgi:hypothetical protein